MSQNCTICRKPIVLTPSAAERAKRFGGKPSDYAALFTEHADCTIAKRDRESRELMARYRENPNYGHVI